MNYSELLSNIEDIQDKIEGHIFHKYYTRKVKQVITYSEKYEDEKEYLNKLKKYKEEFDEPYFVLNKIKQKEVLDSFFYDNENKEFEVKKHYRKLKGVKAPSVFYGYLNKVNGELLKPKGEKSLKFYYALHLVDYNEYLEKEKENGFNLNSMLNSNTFIQIGDTIKPNATIKEIIKKVYLPYNELTEKDIENYGEIRKEVEKSEGKMIVVDFIGSLNAIDFSFEYINKKYENCDGYPITKQEIYDNFLVHKRGINLKILEVVTYILCENAKKDSDISSIS